MFLAAAKLEQAIGRSLTDALRDQGFALEPTGGVGRWRDDIYMYVGAAVTRIGGTNRVAPFAQLGFREPQEIYNKYVWNEHEAAKIAVDLQVEYCYFSKGKWGDHLLCQQEAELPALLQRIRELAALKILPFLEQHTDPRKVLELYLRFDENSGDPCEPPGWRGHGSALGALLLARLYAPEHYAPLKKRYAPVFKPLVPEIKEKAMRLIAYLDQRTPG